VPAAGALAFQFTLARGQNEFFVELAEALAHELRGLGAAATVRVDEAPVPSEGLIHVLLPPHEYVVLSGHRPPPGVLKRCILISAEQPQSSFFGGNLDLARQAGAVFDINPRAVRAYRAEDIPASSLDLGHTDLWDGSADGQRYIDRDDDESRRDIDILFLGRLTDRRAEALASYADIFERFRCRLMLSDNARPNVAGGASFVSGAGKRALLARAKVLINIHGEGEPYFEWLRVAEAICAGCAIVSEHSSDMAPLVTGHHLLAGRLESLALMCACLLDDDGMRSRMRRRTYELLRDCRPLANAARALIEKAHAIDENPVDRYAALETRQLRARTRTHIDLRQLDEAQPLERHEISIGEAHVLRALKNQQLAALALRRQLARIEHALRDSGASPATSVLAQSPGWRAPIRRAISVVIPLYNHAEEVTHALASLARSSYRAWEVVVVDDGSTDGGADTVVDWITRHPHCACRLVRHELNRGLAAARNTGIVVARGPRLLMLDADNEIRRTCMTRLSAALDADPSASFAYGIMERFSTDGHLGLMSCYEWDPLRFRVRNYIDAFALITREALTQLDGYSYDPRLYGWEDYDLWVRMAEAGMHGAFVPEIIARYRVGHSSMISQTNVSTADAYAGLVDHAPTLMAGLRIPR
jgi:Glycosyl transferase family 2